MYFSTKCTFIWTSGILLVKNNTLNISYLPIIAFDFGIITGFFLQRQDVNIDKNNAYPCVYSLTIVIKIVLKKN